jgi:hypothetical protein
MWLPLPKQPKGGFCPKERKRAEKMTNLTITATEQGLYISATSKGVKYGQRYPITDEAEALKRFKGLVKTYETKGALYVAQNGSAY